MTKITIRFQCRTEALEVYAQDSGMSRDEMMKLVVDTCEQRRWECITDPNIEAEADIAVFAAEPAAMCLRMGTVLRALAMSGVESMVHVAD